MSTLVSAGSGGLFSAAASWQLCDPIAELDSEQSTTSVTSSYATGAAFLPGAITIDAIAIKPSNLTSATGTLSVSLITTGALSGVTLTGTQVTLSMSDLPTGIGTSAPDYGWMLFKLTGNFTTTAATNYNVQVKSAPTTIATLYRSGAAGNWARQLRTTTNQAPAATDKLIIVGEYSGQGSGRQSKIIMNVNNSGTGYGSIWISRSGILEWKTDANTYLNLTGNSIDGTLRGLEVCASGTLNMGTSGTPIQSGVTGTLEFGCTSNVAFGLEARAGSFVNVWGS